MPYFQFQNDIQSNAHHSPGNSVDAVPSHAVSRDQSNTCNLEAGRRFWLKWKIQAWISYLDSHQAKWEFRAAETSTIATTATVITYKKYAPS